MFVLVTPLLQKDLLGGRAFVNRSEGGMYAHARQQRGDGGLLLMALELLDEAVSTPQISQTDLAPSTAVLQINKESLHAKRTLKSAQI